MGMGWAAGYSPVSISSISLSTNTVGSSISIFTNMACLRPMQQTSFLATNYCTSLQATYLLFILGSMRSILVRRFSIMGTSTAQGQPIDIVMGLRQCLRSSLRELMQAKIACLEAWYEDRFLPPGIIEAMEATTAICCPRLFSTFFRSPFIMAMGVKKLTFMTAESVSCEFSQAGAGIRMAALQTNKSITGLAPLMDEISFLTAVGSLRSQQKHSQMPLCFLIS